jgi:hypothetical protein
MSTMLALNNTTVVVLNKSKDLLFRDFEKAQALDNDKF